MQEINCDSYSIIFNNWARLNELCGNDYSTIMVLVDEHTAVDCLPVFLKHFDREVKLIQIASGEQNKTVTTCQQIWKKMMELGADRHSLLINLGGGVIGDMGGFCAATYMRGIDFIQLPTTLLSMVDSSVGGKLGVDLAGAKNIVGLFSNPQAVFVFPEFLNTLPVRELKSGMAEVYKHGLIRDTTYFSETIASDTASDTVPWIDIISRSVEIKKDIVLQDPLEGGLRKILNFGHTIGHAIESINLGTDTHLLHGEAIALGMIAEAYISTKKSGLSQDELSQITDKLKSYYVFPDNINLDIDQIMSYCLRDKKNKHGVIRASLLSSIGECVYNVELSREDVEWALGYVGK